MLKMETVKATPKSEVVKNIKLKRDLLNTGNPEHECIRTAVICDSGIMLGVFGGGVVTGLEECGMIDVFDYAIGVSAGAANLAYFLAGQSRLGTSIYYEDLPDNKFIDLKRFRKFADLDLLEKIFRGEKGSKRLKTDLVKNSRTKLLIAVTNAQTGQGELIDTKDPNVDVVTAIKASAAIPIAYNRTIAINGQEYSDGASSLPLPVDYAKKELGCNNILVIMHKPYSYRTSLTSEVLETVMASLYMRNCASELRKSFLRRHQTLTKILNNLWNYHSIDSVNIGVIGFDKFPFSKFSMNKQKSKALATVGEQKTIEIFT